QHLLHELERRAPSVAGGGVAAVADDDLNAQLELAAVPELDPAQLEIVADAEVDVTRQRRRGRIGRRPWLAVDGESAVTEAQILAELDVRVPDADTGRIPVEEIADVDGLALVVAGARPRRPSVEPGDALEVEV